MAEKKPFIAARLRNPVEEAAAAKKAAGAAAKTDWVGGICAIIAFVLAVVTTTFLYLEWDLLTKYIGH